MDSFDARIVRELERDGRLSWVKLAGKVNLSASACQRRVEALQSRGLIERFTVLLNEAALGYGVKAFVAVSIDRQDPAAAREFRRWVAGHRLVQACHMLSGADDFMLEVVAEDLESLGRFLDGELLSQPAVKDASSSIVLGKVKSRETAVSF
ncbi:MAG: Lrp/AsnC family transcriptional regulator [Gammaproteobacteria bacterium]|nr:Lrp/AsnC family transcriptional regulator [Gammaproteobacteria bacterium]MCY4344725.1 Lrp/AsnC family transcriptional regulator [Gammaproteobacteria bacterium]